MPVDSYIFSYAQQQKNKKFFFVSLTWLIIVLLFLQLLFSFFIKPLSIASTSMHPEFSKNNAVFLAPLVNGKTLFSSSTSLTRGTMVTIENGTIEQKSFFQNVVDFIISAVTFHKFSPYESSRWGDSEVYRVIGLPGDTLYIEDYIVYIKQKGSSHFLTEFEYSDVEYDVLSEDYPNGWNMTIGAQGNTEQIVIQNNEYFLLCDNRLVSTDSRIFGAIHEDNISAKVVAQYFPFNSIRAF